MAAVAETHYRRPYADVRTLLLRRAERHRNPFEHTDLEEMRRVMGELDTLDRDTWAEAFSSCAPRHEEAARAALASGDERRARDEFWLAYGCYRVARYPAPNSPAKRTAYLRSQEMYLSAARFFDPPLERVEIPFRGRTGEGGVIVAHLRRPQGVARAPVVITWGGIDSFKEERRADPYLGGQLAVLIIDMPGVADAPIAGSEDAERLWDPIFDWLAARPDVDGGRVAVVGSSTGGYWATKLAHTRRERLRAAVNHGGPAHFAFRADWIARATSGEYPFELAETLACAFGRSTHDEWIEYAPRLSLLDQGVLDGPSAPLLCVNGVGDSVFPIADHYLLLEHGAPKSARLFPGGHMGDGPDIMPTIVGWLRGQLLDGPR